MSNRVREALEIIKTYLNESAPHYHWPAALVKEILPYVIIPSDKPGDTDRTKLLADLAIKTGLEPLRFDHGERSETIAYYQMTPRQLAAFEALVRADCAAEAARAEKPQA